MAALSLLGLLLVGVFAFAAANIDDIFVLMVFFSNPNHKTRKIVLGQYLGFGLLVGVSLLASLLGFLLPTRILGLMGLVPLALGLKKLVDLKRWGSDSETERAEQKAEGSSLNLLAMVGVTFSDGGDDIGVFVPLFATHATTTEASVLVAAFLLMTGVYCAVGHYIARRSVLATRLSRISHLIFPIVLIGVGILVLVESFFF